MIKRNKGIVFLLIGILLLLVAVGMYLNNINEDKKAGQKAREILIEFDAALQNPATFENPSPVIKVMGNEFCGKIIVDKLGLELPVYDKLDANRLKSAPCRYSGSVDTNDIIIAAHNYKSHFGALGRMEKGDKVSFVDAYGITRNFEVCEVVMLDGTAISDMHSGGWDLTLFTCTKNRKQRVTIRCEKIL